MPDQFYNKSLQRFSKRKFWTSKFTKNQKIDHLLHISLHGHSNEWWQTCNDSNYRIRFAVS